MTLPAHTVTVPLSAIGSFSPHFQVQLWLIWMSVAVRPNYSSLEARWSLNVSPKPASWQIVLCPSSNNLSLCIKNHIFISLCSICVLKFCECNQGWTFSGKYFLHAMSLYPLWIVLQLYVAPLNMNTESKLCFVVFCFLFFSECGRCSQSSDGQHATQWWHARWTHAPGLLSSKEKNLL